MKRVLFGLAAALALVGDAAELPPIVAAEQKETRWVIIDPAKTEGYAWQWSPKGDPNIRPEHYGRFGNPSEVKPTADGKLLVACSCRAFAKIDVATCRAEFYGVVADCNPHSIEVLPDGCVALVSSHGNSLTVMDVKGHEFDPANQVRVASAYLRYAHGVVWDAARSCLWGIGVDRLVKFAWNGRELKELAHWELKDSGCGTSGHDLVLSDDGTLLFTTHQSIGLFDPVPARFSVVTNQANVKSVSRSAGETLVSIPRESWWTDTLVVGEREIRREGARFYKARFYTGRMPAKAKGAAGAAERFTADWSRVKPYVSTVDRAKGDGVADFTSEVRDGSLIVTVRALTNATVKALVGLPSKVVPYAGRHMTVRTTVSGEGIDACDGLMQGYIDRSDEGKERKHYWKPSTMPVLGTPSVWTKTRHLDPKLGELSFSFVMKEPGVYRFHRLEFFEAPDPLSAYAVGSNALANGGAEQGHYATSAVGESAQRFGTCGDVIEPNRGKVFSGLLKPRVSETVAHSGVRSFELELGEGEDGRFFLNPVPTVDDRAAVFSFWVKAKQRCHFRAGLFVMSGAAYEKTFTATPEWTRIALRVPRWGQKGEDGLSFYGRVTGAGVAVPYVEPEAGTTIWVDDAFATVGALDGACEASKAVVTAVRTTHPRGIYRPGEPVRGVVRVSGLKNPARIERRLYDWRNREIAALCKSAPVSGSFERAFSLLPPDGLRGPMTMEWTLLQGTDVISRATSYFGVQPVCERLEPRLSVNVMFGSPEQSLSFMREFGVGGARLWGGCRNWNFDYGYRYSRLFHDAGIRTLFVLDEPRLVHDGKVLRNEALLPVDVTDWFARQMELVDAHRGEIDVYEFLNEYNIWKGRLKSPDPSRFAEPTMEKYLASIAAFRPLLKAHDPQALLAGCATCSTDIRFIGEFLEKGGGAHVDMITEHAYSGNPDCPDYAKKLDEGLALARAAGVRKWAQSEAGATSPNHLLPGLIDERALEQAHNDLRNMLIAWAKGLDHYSHFQLSTGRTGTDWNLTYLGNGDNGFEDLPKPALFAFRAAADLVGAAKCVKELSLGPGVRCFIFDRGDRRVAVLWQWNCATRTIRLSDVLSGSWFDMMGGRIRGDVQTGLSIFPLYCVTDLTAAALERALKSMKSEASGGPGVSVGADSSDPNMQELKP